MAYATLWTTARRSAFSMDLMRYADDAPNNIMDYLFVELINWGREQGYEAFEFGMAPLAGSTTGPWAPMMSRVGRVLFERGEEIYNFQGVRRYKDKYDPLWQPRYCAAPHKWSIPLLMPMWASCPRAGWPASSKRPKKVEEPRRSSRRSRLRRPRLNIQSCSNPDAPERRLPGGPTSDAPASRQIEI